MQVRVKSLLDYGIKASDGEVGSVSDVLFDDQAWCVRYFVVDTGPWLFGRKVLLSPESLTGLDSGEQTINTSLTKDQVKSSPEIDVDPPLSRAQQLEYHNYYGWPVYWGAGATLGTVTMADVGGEALLAGNTSLEPNADSPPLLDDRDINLRSSKAITGFKAVHGGQEFAEVEDLVLDSDGWQIASFVLNSPDEDREHQLPVGQITKLDAEGAVHVDAPPAGLEIRASNG